MKSVYNELYNRKDKLNEFKVNANQSKRIDVKILRDIIFGAIKNDTNFLNEIKEGNKNFILEDDFLKDILNKRNQDYIISGLFGKEEHIKVSLISLINKLAHRDDKSQSKNSEESEILNKYKESTIKAGIKKRKEEDYKYSSENVVNELEDDKDNWYNRKKASYDLKILKKIFELSGAAKNKDDSIKNKDLLDFNSALNYKEIQEILFELKKIIMVECIRDKRINKAVYLNEQLNTRKGSFIRIAFNTDDQYMLTMAHLDKEIYDSISDKFTSKVKMIKDMPRSLSTTFPIFPTDEEWKLEENYKNTENSYRTKFRHIKDKYEEYARIDKDEKEEINDN